MRYIFLHASKIPVRCHGFKRSSRKHRHKIHKNDKLLFFGTLFVLFSIHRSYIWWVGSGIIHYLGFFSTKTLHNITRNNWKRVRKSMSTAYLLQNRPSIDPTSVHYENWITRVDMIKKKSYCILGLPNCQENSIYSHNKHTSIFTRSSTFHHPHIYLAILYSKK
jgi:uncharacterized Zn-finger protein